MFDEINANHFLVAFATFKANIISMKSSPVGAIPTEHFPVPDNRNRRAATCEDGKELRTAVQAFVRGLGLLSSDRTPWGGRLSISHAHALLILLECSQRGYKPTQRELGSTLGIDKSNVARLCARMEAARHMTQERCRQDARARRLIATEHGLELAVHVEEASGKLFTAVMSMIPPHTRAGVVSALEALDAAVRDVLKAHREDLAEPSPSAKKAK